jgi:hypothetical protein
MSENKKWRYVHASVEGTSHLFAHLPCQDASDSCLLKKPTGEEILALVVADGAGSAVHGKEGAELACQKMLELLSQCFTSNMTLSEVTKDKVSEWVNQVVLSITKVADKQELTARDYACTLLLAMIDQQGSLFLQIGDGAIVVNTQEGGYKPVFWPMSGEYANTTYFITDLQVLEYLQFTMVFEPIDEVALFSDGLQRLALQHHTRQAHTPFFLPMFSRLRQEPDGFSKSLSYQLEEFLGSAPVNRRTDDDKTLVLATRLSPISNT